MNYFYSDILPKLIVVITIISVFLLGLYLGKLREVALRKKYIKNNLKKSARIILDNFFEKFLKTYLMNSNTKYFGGLEKDILYEKKKLKPAISDRITFIELNNIVIKFIKKLESENAKAEITKIIGEDGLQKIDIQIISLKNSFFSSFMSAEDEKNIDDFNHIDYYFLSLRNIQSAFDKIVAICEKNNKE